MSDGNMAIQVSPVSEEDMSKARQVFEQALNSIVSLSQLSKDVEVLRQQVNDLTNTVNRYRSQIDTLDDALYRTRQERDEAVRRANSEQEMRLAAERSQHDAEQARDHLQGVTAQLTDTVNRVSKERDDAQYKVMELEEKLAMANDRLNDIKSMAMDAFGLTIKEEPKPEPTYTPPAVEVAPLQQGYPPVVTEPSFPVEGTDTPNQEPSKEKPWWESDRENLNKSQIG